MERVGSPRTILIVRWEAQTLGLFVLYTCTSTCPNPGPDMLCGHTMNTKDGRNGLRGTWPEDLMT